MPGLGAASIAAGGILGGSAIGAKSQEETNELMQTMSNTQYQRAMADMEAAGLNPILAGDKGGAGTPSLTAPAKGTGMGSAARALTMDLPQSQAEVASKEANTAVAGEVKKRTQEETALTKANQEVARTNAERNRVETKRAKGTKEYIGGAIVDEATNAWSEGEAKAKKAEEERRRERQTADDAKRRGKGTVYEGAHSAKEAERRNTHVQQYGAKLEKAGKSYSKSGSIQ